MGKSTCVSCIKKEIKDNTREVIRANTTTNKIKGKTASYGLEKKKKTFILRLQRRANDISEPYLTDKSGMYKLFLIELRSQIRRLKKSKITTDSEPIFSTGLKILQNEYYHLIGKDMFSKKFTIFLEENQYDLKRILSIDTRSLQQHYSEHKIQKCTLISTCLALIFVVNNT